MLPLYRYLLVAFVATATLLTMGYGYVAATESTGPKKGRATLVATLAFSSFFIVLPVGSAMFEARLPVFELNGVIQAVNVQRSSSRNYSAWLSIKTPAGGSAARMFPGRRSLFVGIDSN